MKLKNKIAVVTGGNSGIGKAIVEDFIKQGAYVAILGRNKVSLAELEKTFGKQLLAVCGDVTQSADLIRLYEQTQNQFGAIDIVVANAGISIRAHVSEVTEDLFDNIMNINCKGCYFTVKHSLDYLNTTASVLFISSIAAHVAPEDMSLYCSSKAAVSMLAKCFAKDLAHRKIRVNAISPGFIETPIWKQGLENDPQLFEKLGQKVPLERFAQAAEVAKLATFGSTPEKGAL